MSEDYFDTQQRAMERTLAAAMRDRRINIGQDANFMREFITAKRANDLAAAFDVAMQVRIRYGKTVRQAMEAINGRTQVN